MGLCACNSAGHLSNHADIAPNHAGITFAISNTLVSYYHHHFSCVRLQELLIIEVAGNTVLKCGLRLQGDNADSFCNFSQFNNIYFSLTLQMYNYSLKSLLFVTFLSCFQTAIIP